MYVPSTQQGGDAAGDGEVASTIATIVNTKIACSFIFPCKFSTFFPCLKTGQIALKNSFWRVYDGRKALIEIDISVPNSCLLDKLCQITDNKV